MARGPSRDLGSSLFPFLSVLACVIGTLTLLIASLAIGQVAEDLLDSAIDPLEVEHLDAQRAELRALEQEVEALEHLAEELAAARAELRALGVRPDQSELDRQREVEIRHRSAQLTASLPRLERENEDLVASIQGVEVALVNDRPGSDTRPMRILPHGKARPLRPYFVECREDGVRVHHENLRESFYLARGSLDDVARLRSFLQRVRGVLDGTVIFLIRPNGVGTYEWVSEMSGRLFVRQAKLPLPSQGSLEFAL
ncbi:MAG: hypothetical protein VCC19_02440 [Myxococcota bacterium]